jgi:hypothetical protein
MRTHYHIAVLFFLSLQSGAEPVLEWGLGLGNQAAWIPNADIRPATKELASWEFQTVGSDPFFLSDGIEFAATPWQYLLLEVKADRSGAAEIFWTGDTTGRYGGLSETKKTRFRIAGGDTWQTISIFPFWQTEGFIRKMRFDFYGGARFQIASLRIMDWGSGRPPVAGTYQVDLRKELPGWQVHPGADDFMSPPLNLAVSNRSWVTLEIKSAKGATGSVLWACGEVRGLESEDFEIIGDGQMHTYNILLGGIPSWRDPIVAIGLRLPKEVRGEGFAVGDLKLAESPSGPPWLEVPYFGFENGINRLGQPCRILARIRNRGGSAAQSIRVTAKPDHSVSQASLTFVQGDRPQASAQGAIEIPRLEPGEQTELVWTVSPKGSDDLRLTLQANQPGEEPAPLGSCALHIDPAIETPQKEYVPEVHPVHTDLDVCMYYFPGWDSTSKWDCIRRLAPIRKPLLGYYDESNPECVDWQIKWAAENGIRCFLVDWYWNQGSQALTHWIKAYQKARYRDHLKIALMWANHNPPGSHSPADWEAVTREWIDHYFPLQTYYRIDGKPAVFLWDPSLIRHDLGGTEAVRKAFDHSQDMARAAGFPGITFIAMERHNTRQEAVDLLAEGYAGATNYHEWGTAIDSALSLKRLRYKEVVHTVPEAWARHDETCGKLCYYPLVDTGWDSRPWHGDKSLVIEGRTTGLFGELLEEAKRYCLARNKPLVVLGPANEWGEGSYIEPCTEFGFAMYEQVRRVFGKGDPAAWPVNLGPADVGLGSYDFKQVPPVTRWTFESGLDGWSAMMNIGDLRVEEGFLKFKTSSPDAALMTATPGLSAGLASRAVLRMRIVGAISAGSIAQLFWSPEGSVMNEATSVRVPLSADGEAHDYRFNLAANPRWKGSIATLRLDPCETQDVEILVDELRFE